MEDVYIVLKLITGEEVISRLLTSDDPNVFVLDKPLILAMSPKGDLSLNGPIVFSAAPETPIKLNRNAVSFYTHELREELKNGYISEISNIFIPAPKRIIMG